MRFHVGVSLKPKQILAFLGSVVAIVAALIGTGVITP